MKPADYWIEHLQLQPHPEGGFFREVYRAEEKISASGLPPRFVGSRSFSTSIYFLLPGTSYSKLHRIKSDEIWHFYEGAPVDLHIIDSNGAVISVKLGRDPDQGEVLQVTAPRNCWFAARCAEHQSYSLVGCTVAPGFDFRDFELGSRKELLELYPVHRQLIEDFT